MVAVLNPRGVIPRSKDCELPPDYASIAENVRLDNGRLEPWRQYVKVLDVPPGTKRIHNRDCCWAAHPDSCARYTEAKACEQTFLSTANEKPMVSDSLCHTDWSLLGWPIPMAPGVELYTDPAVDCDADVQERRYVITYGDGCEEGAPSPPTQALYVNKDQGAMVTLPSIPPECWGITQVNVYRLAATWDVESGLNVEPDNRNQSNGLITGWGDPKTESFYFLVGEVQADQGFFLDEGGKLGRRLISDDFFPPACGLQVAGETRSGSLIGWVGKEVWFSERNAYHAWPLKSRMSFEETIVQVCVCEDNVFVLTEAKGYVVSDSVDCKDSTCRPVAESKQSFPATSARSCVLLPNAVLYSSTEGLVFLGADTSSRIVSNRAFAKDDWALLDPSQIQLEMVENHLILLTGRESVVWNMSFDEGGQLPADITTLSFSPDDLSIDHDNELYFLMHDSVWHFNAGTQYMNMRWRQATQDLGESQIVDSLRLKYEKKRTSNRNTVSLFKEGRLMTSRPVGNAPVRLRASLGRCYQVEVKGNEPVCSLYYGTGIASLIGQ